ncbi:hypothetical protein BDV93DRAFT_520963 [Ceratobasidium sp. AG-I]|nr:hypothetical protein BDV93DRAFT_520963 [Ceratobasidium sp. AG-I]
MKHSHGPLPLSCLTCRQRRKKCDRSHPVCTRCTDGGFKCLGYDGAVWSGGSSNLSTGSSQLDIAPVPRTTLHKPKQRKHLTHTPEEEPRVRPTSDGSHVSRVRIRGDHNDTANDLLAELLNASSSLVPLDSGYLTPPQASPQPTRLEASSLPLSNLLPPQRGLSPELIDLLPNLSGQQHNPSIADVTNHFMLPPRFYPDAVISGLTVKFILSLYEPLYKHLAFKPTHARSNFIRDMLVDRIQASSLTHWSMYLGAKIFCTLLQGGKGDDLRVYNRWFERLDQLCITSSNDTILDDLANRLSGGLELSYLKFMTSNINAGLTLLRNIAPTFVKVAFADPSLWPRQPGCSGISLVHAFTSDNYDLGRFVFMDTISTLCFGVPPLVEYDTSAPVSEIGPSYTQRIESKHGCAANFIIGILKISIWRAQNDKSPVKHRWEEIEADIRGWVPGPDNSISGDSWKTVARLAILEGWRHTGLIYLYMGMCGVTSHDPRVQSSVRQIMSLLDVIKFDDPIGLHFFFPRLLAGICVRGEKQRAQIRESMAQSKKNPTWLFRWMDLVPVLDHLWHGVAANGGAVTWDDYIRSRRTNIHIDL